jgi:hypothetical protein
MSAGTNIENAQGAGHPGNPFVTPTGQIVVLDFGLSKELPEGFGLACYLPEPGLSDLGNS